MKLPRFVNEALVRASKTYQRKEAVRAKLQELVQSMVTTGEIKTQGDLKEFFDSVQLATTALASIPIEVYVKLSQLKPKV